MRIVREKDILEHSDEFSHYGVLGMKWGVHRAKVNKAKSSKYRSKAKASTGSKKEKNLKKADKYAKKSKKIQTKHESRAGKKTYKKVDKTSVVKLLGESALIGTYGSLKYNKARANGKNVFTSFANGAGHSIVNNALFNLPSLVEPRIAAYKARSRKRNNSVK